MQQQVLNTIRLTNALRLSNNLLMVLINDPCVPSDQKLIMNDRVQENIKAIAAAGKKEVPDEA